jgi:Ca2+-binding EF-hand superfamily protein
MLSLKTDFNIEDAFRIFDVDEKGYIGFREIEEAYNLFSLYPKKEELELLLKKYDKDQDGKLNYLEFTNCLKPKDKNYASLLLNRKAFHQNHDFQR